MTTAVAAPFRSFAPRAAGTRRLGPSPVRVTFTGPELGGFRSDGHDRSLSSPLPDPGRDRPVVPLELGDNRWQVRRELPDGVRAVTRSYTLRAPRTDARGRTAEIDVDLVLHGVTPQAGPSAGAGPASRRAARAAVGDRVLLFGPAIAGNRAIRFRPPEDTSTVPLWADRTRLPGSSAVPESLPAGPRPGPAGGAARRGRPGAACGRGDHLVRAGGRRRPGGPAGPGRRPADRPSLPRARLRVERR